jgi:hypothetical protein
MPGGDGTGPMGEGPMTGRAAGYCAGNSQAGFANSMPRMGLGLGRGRGFMTYRYGNMQAGQHYYPTLGRFYGGMGFFGKRRGGRGRRFRF